MITLPGSMALKKILKHLGLWDRKARLPPKATGPPKLVEHHIDYSLRGVGPYGPEAISLLPMPARRLSGGSDKWLYVDPEYPETYPARFFNCEASPEESYTFIPPNLYPLLGKPNQRLSLQILIHLPATDPYRRK
jgi:hypothetical protein